MHEGGGDRREREAVGKGEGRRQEKRAVGFVLGDVYRRVVVNDLRHVVRLPEAIEGCARRDSVAGFVRDGLEVRLATETLTA